MEDGKEYTYREPTQKPINPPYQSALAIKRKQGGANLGEQEKGDTSLAESKQIGANCSEEEKGESIVDELLSELVLEKECYN